MFDDSRDSKTMIRLGHMNALPVVAVDDKFVSLDADEFGQVTLPRTYLTTPVAVGDTLPVFTYLSGDGELQLSLEKPRAEVGDFATLRCVSVNSMGAFLDCGLRKDILVPRNEQARPMEPDRNYVVYLYLDRESRMAASSKLDYYLSLEMPRYEPFQEVDVLICDMTPMGFKVVVDGKFWGLVFRNEVFRHLRIGEKTKGYIKRVHDDGKLDVTLNKPGIERRDEVSEKILAKLSQQNGFLAVNDKSDPALIMSLFGTSKGTFKKAIGGLYKQGLITIEATGIARTDKPA